MGKSSAAGRRGKEPQPPRDRLLYKTSPARHGFPGGGQASHAGQGRHRGALTEPGATGPRKGLWQSRLRPPSPRPPARCRQHRLPKDRGGGALPGAPESRACGAPRRGQRRAGRRGPARPLAAGSVPHPPRRRSGGGGEAPRTGAARAGAGAAAQEGRRGAWPGPARVGGPRPSPIPSTYLRASRSPSQCAGAAGRAAHALRGGLRRAVLAPPARRGGGGAEGAVSAGPRRLPVPRAAPVPDGRRGGQGQRRGDSSPGRTELASP